ncbi:MAG: glycosyltransferase family 4 protein [Candidatus Bathyarchaeota archaeon]
MRVLILAQYFPPDLGGSSTRAYNVARGLVLNGVNTTVVTSYPHYPHGVISREYAWKPYAVEQMNGVKVIRTFMIPLESKGLMRRLVTFIAFIISSLQGLLLVRDIDAVLVANPDIFGIIPGIVYKHVHRCPIIFNVDDLSIEDVENLKMMEAQSLPFRLVKRVSSLLYRMVDAVTPISPGYLEGIQRLGVRKGRIYPVLGGVDLDVFKPQQGTMSSVFTVAYSGSFSVAYDFDQVLDAAELLSGKNSVVFMIQGKGELGEELQRKVSARRISNVQLIDKILTRDEVSGLLGQADALILPLRDFGAPYRGISSKIYEYQALAKPIICCAKGQPADYIEETRSGIVVTPGDSRELADAVLLLSEDANLARSLGESGRKYVEQNVALDRIGSRMKSVITHTLNEKRGYIDPGSGAENNLKSRVDALDEVTS